MINVIPIIFQDKWQKMLDLISNIFSVPVAIITLSAEDDYAVFLSNLNGQHPYNQKELPAFAGKAYSKYVIANESELEVPNARLLPEWENIEDLKFNMINYLGFPLFKNDNSMFGSFCIMDTMERQYSESQKMILKKFIDIIEIDLDIIATKSDSESELKNKRHIASKLRKAIYRSDVLLNFVAKLHNKYTSTPSVRLKNQITDIINLLDKKPIEIAYLDIQKLFRYLIPEYNKSNIILRLDNIDSRLAISTSQALNLIIRTLVLFVLLNDINTSIFTDITDKNITINFLVRFCESFIEDFNESIKEALLSLSEESNGSISFEFLDDAIFKIAVKMPIIVN